MSQEQSMSNWGIFHIIVTICFILMIITDLVVSLLIIPGQKVTMTVSAMFWLVIVGDILTMIFIMSKTNSYLLKNITVVLWFFIFVLAMSTISEYVAARNMKISVLLITNWTQSLLGMIVLLLWPKSTNLFNLFIKANEV